MTILILTDYYPPDKLGGVGEIARQLRESYRKLGHRVLVLTTGRRRGDEAQDGIMRSAPSLMAGVLFNNLLVLRLIRREPIALIHLHQSSTTLFLLAKAFLRRFPFVLNSLQVSYVSEAREIRGATVGRRRFRPRPGEYIERFLLAPVHIALDFVGYLLSDRVTVVSHDNRSEIARTFGRLHSKPLEVVPNGVPDHCPMPDFRDPALEARLHGKVVLAYVGVFRTRKRVHTLLLAMQQVARRRPDAVLMLVGGGRGYEDQLKALAVDLGIEQQVIFVGPVPSNHVRYYLSLTDVFCLLSSYEGMPVAMLEAMNEGKAIVATNGYGMRDLMLDVDARALVEVDDVPAAAAALLELIEQPARRAAMGQAARQHVQRRLRWDAIAERYLRLAEAE